MTSPQPLSRAAQRAPAQPRGRRLRLWRALLAGSAWVGTVFSVVLHLIDGAGQRITGLPGLLDVLGAVAGLIAMNSMLFMLLLAARVPVIDRVLGRVRAIRWHRLLGRVTVLGVLTHVALILTGTGWTNRDDLTGAVGSLWTGNLPLVFASAALLLLTTIASVFAVCRGLRREIRHLLNILSYVAVGARSVENQGHRLVASGIPVPVGMKNPTGGSTAVMLNSIYAAQAPQTFIFRNWEVATTGNALAHALLRGYQGLDGINYPNYHYEYLERLAERYARDMYESPAVVIDCNHDNSGKRPLEQTRIVNEVLDSVRRSTSIAGLFRGFMVESYLEDGAQPVGGGVFGKSITDACIGWERTELLVRGMAERL